MQQIAHWLQKLGMSEYAQRFAENRIDLSILPDLTDQDLEKLGVLLGDRRKMLRANGRAWIRASFGPVVPTLCGECQPRGAYLVRFGRGRSAQAGKRSFESAPKRPHTVSTTSSLFDSNGYPGFLNCDRP